MFIKNIYVVNYNILNDAVKHWTTNSQLIFKLKEGKYKPLKICMINFFFINFIFRYKFIIVIQYSFTYTYTTKQNTSKDLNFIKSIKFNMCDHTQYTKEL